MYEDGAITIVSSQLQYGGGMCASVLQAATSQTRDRWYESSAAKAEWKILYFVRF